MKIFIDFDDVIFNTKKFSSDLFEIFGRHGITREEFRDSYYTFSKKSSSHGRHYDPDAQIRVLKKKNGVDVKSLKSDVNKFLRNLGQYVFSDVEFFLKNFPKKDLFILSYGQAKFQKIKINGTGIDNLVDRVFITKRKKADVILELARKYAFSKKEAIILIDDHSEQLEAAMNTGGKIKAFHLCRKEGRYHALPCLLRDYSVKNLKAVERIIKKEKM
jgi:FMN phosphatase YigB (HAD superfamily)